MVKFDITYMSENCTMSVTSEANVPAPAATRTDVDAAIDFIGGVAGNVLFFVSSHYSLLTEFNIDIIVFVREKDNLVVFTIVSNVK
jgi:hypothetical protein